MCSKVWRGIATEARACVLEGAEPLRKCAGGTSNIERVRGWRFCMFVGSGECVPELCVWRVALSTAFGRPLGTAGCKACPNNCGLTTNQSRRVSFHIIPGVRQIGKKNNIERDLLQTVFPAKSSGTRSPKRILRKSDLCRDFAFPRDAFDGNLGGRIPK